MADDNFSKFKKRYEEGKVPTMAMPPLPAGPGPGMARVAATGLRGLKQLYDKSQKAANRNAKRRDAAAIKREAAAEAKAARAKEKFGPLVKREDKLPATQGSRAVVKREDRMPAVQGSRAVAKREDRMPATQGSRAVVKREDRMPAVQGSRGVNVGTRTFGDKGAGKGAGMSTNAKRMLAAGAVGGAAYGLYKGADKPKADDKAAPKKEAPRDDRASQLSGSKSDKAAEFRKKQQGMKTPGSPTNPNKSSGTKKAGNKSGAKPEKKMSNFERMKQRQYEKEGYGGRSMTSKGAKERVKTERGFKFKDLFKKK